MLSFCRGIIIGNFAAMARCDVLPQSRQRLSRKFGYIDFSYCFANNAGGVSDSDECGRK